jgi:hypothetical protein
MSESRTGAPGSGPKQEILGSDEQVRSFVLFYHHLEESLSGRGVKMNKLAEVINDGDNDVIANKIAKVFGKELKLDKLHRHDRKDIPTYNDALQKMAQEGSPYLAINPKEAGVFLYQLVMLLGQYGMEERKIFEVIEYKYEEISEVVADEIKKSPEDEEKSEGLSVGEHK